MQEFPKLPVSASLRQLPLHLGCSHTEGQVPLSLWLPPLLKLAFLRSLHAVWAPGTLIKG